MTEQNNPYGPSSNNNSAAGAEGEAIQSPNYPAEAALAEQNPYSQAPNAPQKGTPAYGQPAPQTSDYVTQQPAPAPNPYTQQAPGYGQQPAAGQTPGYGQPNSAQQASGYSQQATTGQSGAYSAPGYGQPGFGQPVFDAYGNQIPSDAESMALFAHLSGLIGLVVTVACLNFIGPLIFWFIYKDKPGYQFVRHAAAGAFNFSFTMWLINVAALVLTVATLGIAGIFTWIILLAVWVALIVLHVIAAVKANNGEAYNYPMALKILS